MANRGLAICLVNNTNKEKANKHYVTEVNKKYFVLPRALHIQTNGK